ncbi:MAG TPA: hypothetical protein VFT14_01680 [Solirubrobacterales bacterium]|nr:hypothetical protein [Solirubrobacterales bacterium]
MLFAVLSGGDDDDGGDGTTTAVTTTSADNGEALSSAPQLITVKDGEPVGGVRTLTYDKGDPVNIEVQLDQPAEYVHVHGYEIEQPAETSPVRLSFPADIDGLFEIEVHGAGGDVQIAELRVNP